VKIVKNLINITLILFGLISITFAAKYDQYLPIPEGKTRSDFILNSENRPIRDENGNGVTYGQAEDLKAAEIQATTVTSGNTAAPVTTNNTPNGFSYEVLEPIQGVGNLGKTSVQINKESFSDFVNSSINYILIISAVSAILYFIYGGLTYLTTDIVNKKSEGKEIITRVVSGLVFILLIFAIFKSINPDLLRSAVDFSTKELTDEDIAKLNGTNAEVFTTKRGVEPKTMTDSNQWTATGFEGTVEISPDAKLQYSIDGGAFTNTKGTISVGQKLTLRLESAEAEGGTSSGNITIGKKMYSFLVVTKGGYSINVPSGPPSPVTPVNKKRCPASSSSENDPFCKQWFDKIQADEARVRQILTPSIQIKDTCKSFTQEDCSTHGLLNDVAITRLMELRDLCNCSIRISGGTEFWYHKSHGPNTTKVDLGIREKNGPDATIKKMKKLLNYTGNNCNSAYLWEENGSIFCDEADGPPHWHVIFK
jgi:hypothetical protein